MDSYAPPAISTACPSGRRKGSSLPSKPITAALITFQLAEFLCHGGLGRAGEAMTKLVGLLILPCREKHPSPEALLVPFAVAGIPEKNVLKTPWYMRRALYYESQPCCQVLVHIPISLAARFLPNPLIFMLIRMAISPSRGHWDQGSTSQPQLKQEGFFLVQKRSLSFLTMSPVARAVYIPLPGIHSV